MYQDLIGWPVIVINGVQLFLITLQAGRMHKAWECILCYCNQSDTAGKVFCLRHMKALLLHQVSSLYHCVCCLLLLNCPNPGYIFMLHSNNLFLPWILKEETEVQVDHLITWDKVIFDNVACWTAEKHQQRNLLLWHRRSSARRGQYTWRFLYQKI